jgi:hypothetical protein
MESLLVNLGKAVPQKMGGRDYLVAPLTLIVPGVLSGSQGPIYYPPEEVERWPGLWNHVPLVVYHPVENGQHVTARDPAVLDKSGVGIVLRDRYADNKRSAEAWFEVEATKRVDATLSPAHRIYPRLVSGAPIEISTGLDLDKEPAPTGAVYNDTPYDSIARNFRPDHLAILPDAKGACSNKDGCGVNVNQEIQPLTGNETFEIHLALNCGGEGGTPGPCKGEGEGKEKSGKVKPLSKAAHSELTHYGWKTMDGATYTHPDQPGNTMTVKRTQMPGGRIRTDIEHVSPKGTTQMQGLEQAKYSLQQHERRRTITGNQSLSQGAKGACSNKDGCGVNVNEGTENCGGEGGTPGPCPSGDKKEGGKTSSPPKNFKGLLEKATDPSLTYAQIDESIDSQFALLNVKEAKETVQSAGRTLPSNIKSKSEIVKFAKQAVKNLKEDYERNRPLNNQGDPMTRKEMIQHLTANCDCWKGKGDEKLLEKMKDDQLTKLVNQSKIVLVVNQIKNKKADNAEGDEAVAGVPWTELATLLGVDLNPADDPIAFASALKAKVDEISSKLGGAPAEEEMPPPDVTMQAIEEEEEEKVAMAAGTQEVEKTANKRKAQTSADWLKGAPPAIRSAVTNAMNIEKQTKAKLVQRLVGNISDPKKRQALGAKMMAKDLDELQELVSLIPEAAVGNQDQDIPNFAFAGGAGGGQGVGIGNEGEDDSENVLPIFTVNFDEMASPKLRQKVS